MCKGSGEQVLRHVQESFLEHTDKRMPKALERALFAQAGKRGIAAVYRSEENAVC
jgi:hypothetical protein